eukprot:2536922-Pleurochrysis_carterae.AAC.1
MHARIGMHTHSRVTYYSRVTYSQSLRLLSTVSSGRHQLLALLLMRAVAHAHCPCERGKGGWGRSLFYRYGTNDRSLGNWLYERHPREAGESVT